MAKPSLPKKADLPPEVVEEYINPLEQSSRWYLATQAYGIRSGASLAFGLSGHYSPAPPSPCKTLYLDATLSKWKAKEAIRVDVYAPTDHFKNGMTKRQQRKADRQALARTVSESTAASIKSTGSGSSNLKRQRLRRHLSRTVSAMSLSSVASKASINSVLPVPRLAIINFHGGGFILGNGTDDARWAVATVAALDAVVFSVNYRLAPNYPYPTSVEDCTDAILQISRRADEWGIDPDRIILSGFSAGGTLSLASWCLLQDPGRWGYKLPSKPPSIVGLALYYPLLDWTVSRPNKRLGCARPDLTLPKGMTDLFDASYIYPPIPREQRTDPRLSPGLMPDDMLDKLPPIHLVLCEFDMLLAEGRRFAERLKGRDKEVSVRIVEREKHAWDKPPPMAPKKSADIEYKAAIESVQKWLSPDKDIIEEMAALTT